MREFIETLGGLTAVARALGESPQCVGNWIYKGKPSFRGKIKLAELAKARRARLPDNFMGDEYCVDYEPQERDAGDAPGQIVMREFINQLGGSKSVAAGTGMQPQAVNQWIKRGTPSARGKNILALLAQEKGVALPDNFLSDDFGKGEQHD